MTTHSPAAASVGDLLNFFRFPNLVESLGAAVARPLMAVQISAGFNGECLSEAQAQEARSRVESQARAFVPNAHVLALCVQGAGTRFGVFARPPAPGEETNRFTTNLRDLSLSTAFPTNFGIFVSLGLLRTGARAKLSEIDQDLRKQGATAASINVAFSEGKIITRIEGTITKTIPDVRFTATVRDSFEAFEVPAEQIVFQSEDGTGSLPLPKLRLRCEGNVTLDTKRAGIIAASILAFLAGSLAAAFAGPAAIPFFLVSATGVAENAALLSREPPQQGGAACSFVEMVQAPDVLLPGQPGEAPKKVAFSYDDVDERADGLVVHGKLSEQDRVPRLGLIRPGFVAAKLGQQSVTAQLRVGTFDLRGPLTYQWTAGAGVTLDNVTAASPRATFSLAGIGPDDIVRRPISVRVTDADGLQAFTASNISVIIDPGFLPPSL